LRVNQYRSIDQSIELRFPTGAPLVLLGENNAGKSNLISALELVLGEYWPGSREPDDRDYFERNHEAVPIEIIVGLEGIKSKGSDIDALIWRYPDADGKPFRMRYQRDGAESQYVSNDVRDQLPCVVVGSDRRLSYQLSYLSKSTFLSRVMREFHSQLLADEARVDTLKEKFEEIKNIFRAVQPFAGFERLLQEEVARLSGNLDYGLSVDFSAYDPANYFHALRVMPSESGEIRTFDELGTGQQQILALAFAYAFALAFKGGDNNLILVIEEPEAYLHPLAQRWVARSIADVSRQGVQVVLTTHSPAFVDVLSVDGLALVRKRGGSTTARQLTAASLAHYCQQHGAPKATADSVLPFYSSAATQDLMAGLFAKRIVLVEGPTEALALPVYLDRVGLNVTRDGIAVLAVHGVTNLPKWWRFFTAYEIPTYLVFDNDRESDRDGRARMEIVKTVGLEGEAQRRALDADELAIWASVAVFGGNFETTLRGLFGDAYGRLEEQARQQFGLTGDPSKPLVARYVAEHIELDAPATELLGRLAAAIRDAT
jgi:putative ATP-dependent endonuclease of OLD family